MWREIAARARLRVNHCAGRNWYNPSYLCTGNNTLRLAASKTSTTLKNTFKQRSTLRRHETPPLSKVWPFYDLYSIFRHAFFLYWMVDSSIPSSEWRHQTRSCILPSDRFSQRCRALSLPHWCCLNHLITINHLSSFGPWKTNRLMVFPLAYEGGCTSLLFLGRASHSLHELPLALATLPGKAVKVFSQLKSKVSSNYHCNCATRNAHLPCYLPLHF